MAQHHTSIGSTHRVCWAALNPVKWNESGFRPPLCTYRLNWARITSWGWWYNWDDTVLQTQDSKFEPWRSEAEHAVSVTEAPHNTDFYTWMGKKHFLFLSNRRDREPNSGVKGSGANHYPRAPAPQPSKHKTLLFYVLYGVLWNVLKI